ncbi:MAG: CehA/McbA family metallohydrolase [Clostridia bacterium]|nr:CehA/McbA family metallohydrolase [Clostridia bacterium]
MRRDLLNSKYNQYKANMHTHSTVSDGLKTPEELRDMYMAEGYSIIAYTDHEKFVRHNELSNESFLALNGFEMGFDESNPNKSTWETYVCHINFVALSPDIENHPNDDNPTFVREYSSECINSMIRRGREKGFFVTHNHPTWSLENYPIYMSYEGHNALELINYVSFWCGTNEYNTGIYDDLLRSGKRLIAVAGDDNHNLVPDSFGAYTVILSENLEYRNVARSLEEGQCYVSEGPEIKELYVEDGKIKVKCSPAKHIHFSSNSRYAQTFFNENGGLITEAEYEILPEVKYMRVTIIDDHNRHACSRGYFIDELLGE